MTIEEDDEEEEWWDDPDNPEGNRRYKILRMRESLKNIKVLHNLKSV